MKRLYSYKYRLNPTEEQQILLTSILVVLGFCIIMFLEQRSMLQR